MKIDQDYLKRLLEIAQGSPRPTFTIEDFDEAGVPHDTDAFEFHMQILNEQRLIIQHSGRRRLRVRHGQEHRRLPFASLALT